METTRVFTADTETDLWQQVTTDMTQDGAPLEYSALLHQGGYNFRLDLDIDPGGGFESGYAYTALTALVPGNLPLRFALHEQDWIHELGKLVGMEDVELGLPDLDPVFMVKTNDPELLRDLLADSVVRNTLIKYQECRLTLAPADDETDPNLHLIFTKETGIVEQESLLEIYHMLCRLLQKLSPQPAGAVA
ncbi:hypothetical protein [Hymenobacter koreensis]|uniref:Uncharacterized protein n=1 Tax=Hymenobacter koreensis TaxID=1084523 RepID=A0ABP8ITJ1_9BACT